MSKINLKSLTVNSDGKKAIALFKYKGIDFVKEVDLKELENTDIIDLIEKDIDNIEKVEKTILSDAWKSLYSE